MPTPPPQSSTIDCTNRTTARGAGRRRVADRVGDAEPLRPGADRRRVQLAQRLGIRARRVLGDEHHGQALLHARTSPPLPSARSNRSIVQSSAYWRIGLDPMKVHASIGTPVRCTISAIGAMSATSVRDGAVGGDLQLRGRRSRAPAARRRGPRAAPAPGSPMSAVSMPSASMRCRISSFCSIVGVRTDGDCSPSRSVSSSSITGAAGAAGASTVFQS